MLVSFAHATIAAPCLDHDLYFNIKRDKCRALDSDNAHEF